MTTRSAMRTRQGRPTPLIEPGDKENTKLSGSKVKGKARPGSKAFKMHCLCRKPDDGSPMIRCEECKKWYHFRCIKLEERDAEDIQTYICPPCHDETGLRTISEYCRFLVLLTRPPFHLVLLMMYVDNTSCNMASPVLCCIMSATVLPVCRSCFVQHPSGLLQDRPVDRLLHSYPRLL